jgi:uncharacterized phage protein (TIGR02218 family)
MFACHLFMIQLASGENLNFTSADMSIANDSIKGENLVFLPYSNLSVTDAIEDALGRDSMTVEGVCELGGVHDPALLSDAQVRVFFSNGHSLRRVGTYLCFRVEIYGNSFRLHLESKYHLSAKSLSENYSRTCRAVFGDSRCGFDVNKLALELEIIKIHLNKVVLRVPTQVQDDVYPLQSGYYNNGLMRLGSINFTIAKHFASSESSIDVYLRGRVHDAMGEQWPKVAVLTPNCDKTLTQCREAYRNTINFRGEPFLI